MRYINYQQASKIDSKFTYYQSEPVVNFIFVYQVQKMKQFVVALSDTIATNKQTQMLD